MGEQVAVILDKRMELDYYTINFDASDLASGTYFYRLQAEDFENVKKMIVLR